MYIDNVFYIMAGSPCDNLPHIVSAIRKLCCYKWTMCVPKTFFLVIIVEIFSQN